MSMGIEMANEIFFGNTGILVYMSNALQLEGLSTKKPRTTKFTSKATAVSVNYMLEKFEFIQKKNSFN